MFDRIVVDVALALALAGNQAPHAEDMTFTLDEDSPLTAELKASDGDGDTLTFRLAKPPKSGEASVTPDGKLTYTPKANFHGKDELSFEATDGKAKVTKKAVLEVSAVNDPPTFAPVPDLRGQEDKPVKGQVSAKDVDGDPLEFASSDEPQGSRLDVDRASGKFTFVPAPNVNGAQKVVIRLTDGTVDVKVPVTIVLDPQNDAPEVKEDHFSTKEDAPLKEKLRASDIDNDPLTYTLTDKPAHGTVDIDASKGAFTYTPAKDYAGDDGFGWAVSDGKATVKSHVGLEVTNVNDPPTTGPVALEGNEDTALQGKVVGKDFDGDDVYYDIKTEPKHGDAEVDHLNGTVSYMPNGNWFGTETFVVSVSDVAGAVPANVTVTIKPVNDAPQAIADSARGNEDEAIAGKLKASDVDNDALAFSLAKPPKNGTVTVDAAGAFKFVPNASFNGEDVFTFEVTDNKGGKAQSTLSLTVKPVNDAPTTQNVTLAVTEDTPAKGAVAGVDIDKDTLSYTIGKAPTKGHVDLDDQKGAFVYTPNANENGADAFTVVVSDGPAQAEATVSVTIAPVNDAPVASAGSGKGDEDAPIKGQLAASDVDKDALTYTIVGKPRLGDVVVEPSSGAFTYTPRANENGADAFAFEVTDGKLRAKSEVKLTVNAVNDAPDVKAATLASDEDKAASVQIVASDLDKDKLTYTESKPPAKGKLVVDAATGKCTYTPNHDENGADAFTIAVSDGKAKSETTVSVTLAPVNDAPIANAGSASGDEDTPIKGQLVASDVDKDALTYTVVGKPKIGDVVVDASTGTYTYTPRLNLNGDDAFTFEVSDGKLRAKADVKIVVNAVNDAPVAAEVKASGVEDKDVTGKLVASDVDKDALTYRVKKAAQHGVVFVDDASGAFRYVPARDWNGKDAFVLETTDGWATTDANVAVEVAAQPDAPVVDVHAVETSEDEPVSVVLAATDPDGEQAQFKVVTQARLGTAEVQGDGKTLRFTPNADVHGEDQLVVEASDGKNKVRAAVPVLVAPRNDAPTIDAVTAQTLEEMPLTIVLTAHDKDGDAVKLALANDPPAASMAAAKGADAKGTAASKAGAKGDAKGDAKDAKSEKKSDGPAEISLVSNLLRIAPRENFAGPVEITVIPSDASGAGAPTKIVVNVANVNDAPAVADQSLTAAADKPTSGTIIASDADAGDELTFSLAVPPKKGSVTIDDAKTGRFTFTPAQGARGDDSFRVRVKDKAGASVSATVHVTFAATGAKVSVR